MDDHKINSPINPGDNDTSLNNTNDDWSQLMSDFGVSEEANAEIAPSESTELSYDQYQRQTSDTLEASLTCAKSFLPQSRIEEISTSLREIEHLEQYEIIGALRERGELSERQEKLSDALDRYGLVSDVMTPTEAESVYNYVHDSDESIINQKIEDIANLVSKIRRGVRLERSWSPSQERFLDYITTKYNAYEKGRVRTDLPCDIKAIYLDEHKDVHIASYKDMVTEPNRLSYDDIPYSEEELGRMLGIPVEDITVDEFLESFGDERYTFAYGPYTYGDIEEINYLCFYYAKFDAIDAEEAKERRQSVAWVQPISSRLLDRFAPIKKNGKKVGYRHIAGATNEFRVGTPLGYTDVERGTLTESLTTNYISKEVLKNRRPNARNLVALATSIGETISCIDASDVDEAQKATLSHLRIAQSYMSKYICEAVNMSSSEAKELYGKKRPVSEDFYEEARNRSEAWTDSQSHYYDIEKNDTMIKLQDWLLRCEAEIMSLNIGQEISADSPDRSFLIEIAKRAGRINNILG